MMRRIHSILLLLALLLGSAGMNYVQAAKATLTVKANPATGGKVKVGNGSWTAGTVNIGTATGQTHILYADPVAGYHFVNWTNNINTSTSTSTSLSVKVSTASAIYTANFAINTYTLTVKTATGNTTQGTVKINSGTAGASATATINHGSSATITATPKTGYHFVQWSDGNKNASRTVTATANATYTATFAINQYTLTVSSNNTNYGTVTGGGTYNHGATANLKATPKTGYHFVKWNDNNTNASRSVTVTAAATYTATFAINQYTLTVKTATNNTTQGTVKINSGTAGASASATINHGSSATITATPATGYHFVKWNDNNTNASRSVTVTAAATYTATFAINTYTIKFVNGSTTLQTSTVNHGVTPTYSGSTPTKSATVQYTYAFSGWSPTIAAATKDQTYTAQFSSTVRKYTITMASNNSEMGYAQMTYIDPVSQGTSTYANTSHAFNYGDQLTLTAYPSDCAHFVKWSDNSTEKTRTVTVTGTKTYTATFAANIVNGTCGATGNEANVQWSLNMCTGALSITGSGAMMDYSMSSNVPWSSYRASIKSVTIANTVTNIGVFAFLQCDNLSSVSMGTGVTYIGSNAFEGCHSLTSITIGNHVTTIGTAAFYGCSNLTSVTIPPSVTSIGSNAFSNCYAMESLYITDLTAWCNISFTGDYSTPFCRNCYSAHRGGGNLYVNGVKVTTLRIPDGITAIKDYTFLGFAGVTSLQLNQVTTIGDEAFRGCIALTSLTIPEGVTTIGTYAFHYNIKLETLTIPSSVTFMGSRTFDFCNNLTDIYVSWTSSLPEWPTGFTSKSPQSSITLHVPTCKQHLYTGGWANYTIDAGSEDRAVSIGSNNATYGLVQYNVETPVALIDKQVSCITSFTVTAIPAEGCHFVEWSDGWLQKTRTLGNLENDTALTALFGPGVPPEIYDDQGGTPLEGALQGAFSVSEAQVVYFSQGPLQFNSTLGTHNCADGTTKPGTWRFAANQYDVVGDLNTGNVYENGVKCSNTKASATYTGWQDMYCWGASGYNGIEPYKANRPSTTSIAGTNYDWGVYNAISNGGNTPGLWRTPTRAEWNYMFNQRPNALELNAPAVVEGMYGLVVLPDDWEAPVGLNLVTNSTQYYTDNVFTAAQWQQMENAGAVFIPGGGWFSWNSSMWISSFRNTGELWASTGSSTSSQHDVQWGSDRQAYLSASSNHVLEQLRLVSDVGGYTKVRFVGIDSHGDKFVIANIYVPNGATPVPPEVPERECYTFAGWDQSIAPANGHVTTYTAVYETDLFTVTVMTDDSSMGMVQLGTAAEQASFTEQFNCGEEITITAIPANGYAFDQWSDNSYQASRIITLTSDTTLKAIFRSTVYPTEHGALPGLFSVSDTKKVVFSQGNLQFNAALGTHQRADGTTANGTWRFAENQYDFVGDNTQGNVYFNDEKCSNERVSNSYNGWIDYFNHGNTGYNKSPTSYTTAYGMNFNSPSVYDWGSYVAISNGGNMPGYYIVNGWIVLQRFQWNYLFNSRANAQDLRSLATVNDVLGCILLPDDWQLPSGIVFTPDESSYATNTYTREQWNRMEQAGAVFLPAAGRRAYVSNGSPQLSYPEIQTTGYVWSSSGIGNQGAAVAMSFGIDNFALKSFYQGTNYDGVSVRLVHYVSSYHIIFRGYKDGEENVVLQDKLVAEGAMPIPPEVPEDDCRTFIGWDRVIEPASGDTEYIAQYELKGPYTITVTTDDASMGSVSITEN